MARTLPEQEAAIAAAVRAERAACAAAAEQVAREYETSLQHDGVSLTESEAAMEAARECAVAIHERG